MTNLSFLMKPASHACNLACPYCFYHRVNQVYPQKMPAMTPNTAETLFRKAFESGAQHFTFTWQGGEPTLMGLDFFRRIVELQQKWLGPGQTVENSLQTNGVLFGEDWARFLKESGFLVGVSLDGDQAIHDHYRYNHAGKGSFSQVMTAIDTMNRIGTQYNILTLVTDANVAEAERIYHFFRRHEFAFWQFIPCYELERKTGKPLPYSISGEALGRFYTQLFDLWYPEDMDKVSIRFFDDVLLYLMDKVHASCTWMKRCDSYIVVEHNGDAYPCDFYVYPEWKLGNINENSLVELLQGNKRQRFAGLKEDLPEACKKCDLLNFCHGDCTKFRRRSKGKLRPSPYCQTTKAFFQHIKPQLPDILERAHNIRQQARLSINPLRY